jgi:N-acetylmuramoyl-L-alanine amidase
MCFVLRAALAAELVNVRFGGDAATTRIVIDADGPISAPATPLVSQGRLTLSLGGLTTRQPSAGQGKGLISGWRFEPRDARVVLEVKEPVTVTHRFLLPPADGRDTFRYVMDIARAGGPSDDPLPLTRAEISGREASAPLPPALKTHLASMAAAAPDRPRAPRARGGVRMKVIVLDPGHGGHDPGARGADGNEKDVTLAAAQILKAQLARSGHYRIVLTRETDTFVPLEERVRIARRAHADLFLSLHADSAGSDTAPHGASVYTLSDGAVSRVNYVVNQSEWLSRTGASNPAVGRLLLDLSQRNTRNRSAVFAGLLVDEISGKVDMLPRSQRDAGYFVLLAPDVPAALLEMGFITNPGDEARLTDPAQARKLMDAVAGAIDTYFHAQAALADN